jgi:hypothetical protein
VIILWVSSCFVSVAVAKTIRREKTYEIVIQSEGVLKKIAQFVLPRTRTCTARRKQMLPSVFVIFCGWFNDAVSNPDYVIASNYRMASGF